MIFWRLAYSSLIAWCSLSTFFCLRSYFSARVLFSSCFAYSYSSSKRSRYWRIVSLMFFSTYLLRSLIFCWLSRWASSLASSSSWLSPAALARSLSLSRANRTLLSFSRRSLALRRSSFYWSRISWILRRCSASRLTFSSSILLLSRFWEKSLTC